MDPNAERECNSAHECTKGEKKKVQHAPARHGVAGRTVTSSTYEYLILLISQGENQPNLPWNGILGAPGVLDDHDVRVGRIRAKHALVGCKWSCSPRTDQAIGISGPALPGCLGPGSLGTGHFGPFLSHRGTTDGRTHNFPNTNCQHRR